MRTGERERETEGTRTQRQPETVQMAGLPSLVLSDTPKLLESHC